MKVRTWSLWLCTLVPALGIGASGCKNPPEETDTDVGECEVDDDCGTGAICEPVGSCVTGDRSNDFDGALPLELEQEVDGAIAPEEDVDFWKFASTGDEWIRVETITDEAEVNTVISVFDPDKRLYAVMDDFPTGNITNYDTVLHAYLPVAGDWYIKVEDRGTFYSGTEFGEGDYALQIKTFTGTTDEVDAIDDPGADVQFDDGSTIFSVGVNVDEAGDDDFINVGIPFDLGPIEVYGQESIPGSDAQVLVEVLDPELENTVIARKTDVGPDGGLLFLETLHQDYVLRATDADGMGGPDYWFVLYIRTREPDYYGFVHQIEPNDDDVAGQVLEFEDAETSSGEPYRRLDFTGQFDSDVDEDWYIASDVAADEYVTVRCTADDWGSLADPEVEVYIDDVLIGSATNGDDDAPDVSNLGPVEAGGELRLRFLDEAGAFGPGAYYGCNSFVTSFEVAE